MRYEGSRRRVLVTGGAGFLGSHLCDRLLAHGHEVLCVDNLFTGTKRNIDHLHDHPRFEFIRHDVTFPLYVEVDEIYNLACPASPIHYQHDPVQTTKTSRARRDQHAGTRQAGARADLAGVDQRGVRRPAGPSADRGLLGQRQSDRHPLVLRRGQALRRDAVLRLSPPAQAARSRSRGSSTPTARGCIPTTAASCPTSSCRRCRNEPITIYGDGTQTRSFCYVDDLIAAFVGFMATPAEFTGPVNLGNPDGVHASSSLRRRIVAMTGSKSRIEAQAASFRRPHAAAAGHRARAEAPRLGAARAARRRPREDDRVLRVPARRFGPFGLIGDAGGLPGTSRHGRDAAHRVCVRRAALRAPRFAQLSGPCAGSPASTPTAIRPPPVERDELLRIREAMLRRGPDGAGAWVSDDRRVGLAHRRLAIIDLSDAGAQPMATADGRLTHHLQRRDLQLPRTARGSSRPRAASSGPARDTEVLLHLYAERGPEMVHALRGMFAFGIWDERSRELFLARDPLGIKPLYYADDGGTFRFATLVDALLKGGGVDTGEDAAGIAGFYLFGCVPEPFTLLSRRARAARRDHAPRRRRGRARAVPLFQHHRRVPQGRGCAQHARSRGDRRADRRDAARHHAPPHGVGRSGRNLPVCRASIRASSRRWARETDREKLHAHHARLPRISGHTRRRDRSRGEVSRPASGSDHDTRWIERRDFRDEWRIFFAGMDQPSTDGVNSYLVAKAAAACGLKVAISGLGGDELFGGYPSFRDVPRMRRRVPRMPRIGQGAARAAPSPSCAA